MLTRLVIKIKSPARSHNRGLRAPDSMDLSVRKLHIQEMLIVWLLGLKCWELC